jgi:hypothetical protein
LHPKHVMVLNYLLDLFESFVLLSIWMEHMKA